MASVRSPHADWLRQIRAAAKEWVKDYTPSGDITPIEETKLAFLGYMQEEHTGLLQKVFSKFAPPQTMMACLWNYCGRDVKPALEARGWETTPNALDIINTHAGAHDLLVRQPSRDDDAAYITLVAELLGRKRDRRERMATNALNSVQEIDERIEHYRSWAIRKSALV